MVAMRVISRMTDSVNVTVRLAACTRLSSDLAQCAPNQFGRAHSFPTFVDRLPYGALGVSAGISQRDECAGCVIRTSAGHSTAAGRRAFRNLEIVELVREVENQLLCLLAPDARHALERRDVVIANRANESIGAERRQQP